MDERSSLGTVSKRGCFFRNARARNTHVEATLNHPFAAQVGFTSQDDYEHYESKAVRDDMFCGLLCDEQNQMDMSEQRVADWVEQLKGEGLAL